MIAKIVLILIIAVWFFAALKKTASDLKKGNCPGCGKNCTECKKFFDKKI